MLSIKHHITLEAVPSASGIEKVGDYFWLMGDNSPYIYRTDNQFVDFEKFQIHKFDELENGVIPKKKKRDLEAMFSIEVNGEQFIYILGSGSKEKRMKGYSFSVNSPEEVQKFNLQKLYDKMIEEAKIAEDEFNIEAAAVLNQNLFLFNRKGNTLFTIKLTDFCAFVANEERTPDFSISHFKLSILEGKEAGFSGATSDKLNKRIIFTASVEQTDSTYFDGETSGSFIGVLTADDLKNQTISFCELIQKSGEVLKVKVESITIHTQDQQITNCFLVTDSDGGISELLEIELA